MNFYANETYGERVAGVYDEWYSEYDQDAISLLAELAGQGNALELGIGTGRIAIPLAAEGVTVSGVDAASSMIQKMQAKANADKIKVTLGNFADVPVDNRFNLIYVVFNTFFALPSQEEQVRCFQNVATHLVRGGHFLIEAFVPDPNRFTSGQVTWATAVTTDRVELDVGKHDSVAQSVISQKVVITDGATRLYPVQIRYCWPAELDLMAQLAGMKLETRWGSWQRTPFTSESQKHISIYS